MNAMTIVKTHRKKMFLAHLFSDCSLSKSVLQNRISNHQRKPPKFENNRNDAIFLNIKKDSPSYIKRT